MSVLDKAVAGLRPSFETIVAAGAAIVTGAAVYLMPVELLQNAVIASGLPEVLPPLDPPLGGRARIGLALVAAGFAFGLVALLVRLLVGKTKPKQARAPKPVADALSAPRLRRRDRHPDAPARAPLSIGREIGAMAEALPERAPLAKGLKTPVFAEETAPQFVPAEPVVSAAWVEPEHMPVVEDALAIEPEFAALEEAPVAEVAPVTTHPAWLEAEQVQPAPRGEPSLADLLERLETALARRGVPAVADVAPAAPIVPAEIDQPHEGDDPDNRLRSALENLKRFAPRRG